MPDAQKTAGTQPEREQQERRQMRCRLCHRLLKPAEAELEHGDTARCLDRESCAVALGGNS